MATFVVELTDHVRAMGHALLALERDPAAAERAALVQELFRRAHSLKGAARAVSVRPIEVACHRLEELLGSVRDRGSPLEPELIELSLAVTDALDDAGHLLRDRRDLASSKLVAILPRLEAGVWRRPGERAPSGEHRLTDRAPTGERGPAERAPSGEHRLVDRAPSGDRAPVERAPSGEHRLEERKPTGDRAPSGEHRLHARTPTSDGPTRGAGEGPTAELRAANTPRTGPVRSDSAPSEVVASGGASPARTEGTVRVAAEKLDAVLARSGELLVARRRLATGFADVEALRERVRAWEAEWNGVERPVAHLLQAELERAGQGTRGPGARTLKRAKAAVERTPARLRELAKELDRLHRMFESAYERLDRTAATLEEDVRRVRMLPLADACLGLDRSVRDLAKVSAKDIELVIEGGDVELDRAILEELKDPLLHLVRNSADHGIERAQDRRAAGKPERGRITISAMLRAGLVEIAVADDGRGIDVVALRELARIRKLPVPEGDAEAVRLVFTHGVSTSRMVTEISGRGVGLDVVKSRVEALHGAIDVESKPGRGTRFVLTVPLTLTTVRAVMVGCAGQVFAIPASSVLGSVRVGASELRTLEGREVLSHGQVLHPVVSLAQVLRLRDRDPQRTGGRQVLLILSTGTVRAALAIDELIGEQEVVAKPLGPRLEGLVHLAGATVLGDGRLALILSPAEVVRTALGMTLRPIAPTLGKRPATEERKRLLVADDSVTTRTLEKSILESAGYEVDVAADGLEAWQRLQAEDYDLVVADVEMPRMTGFELTEKIRATKRFRALPIVLVTALESEEDKRRGLDLGADAYIVKNAFDQDTLLEAVAQLA